MSSNYILVLAAVASEIQGILDRITQPSVQMIGGRSVQCGRICGMPLRILVTGPGIVNTVQAITACVENARPSLILQTGCGGGFRQLGMTNGDIAVATTEVDIHLGIETGKHNAPLQEIPFPVLEIDGKALKENYPLNLNLAETAFLRLKAVLVGKELGYSRGRLLPDRLSRDRRNGRLFCSRHFHPVLNPWKAPVPPFYPIIINCRFWKSVVSAIWWAKGTYPVGTFRSPAGGQDRRRRM